MDGNFCSRAVYFFWFVLFFRVLYHLGAEIEKLMVGKENDIVFESDLNLNSCYT